MSYSNSTEEINGGASSNDDDEEDKGKNFGSRISAPISISSRLSFSSPRGSPLRSSALSPASSTNGYLGSAAFEPKITKKSKRKAWYKKRVAIGLAVLLGCFFLMNWWMIYRIQEAGRRRGGMKVKSLKSNSTTVFIREELQKLGRGKKPQKTAYARLLSKAIHALAEGESKPEPKDLWAEPYARASTSWTPCSHKRNWKPSEGQNGYIMVTANGGVNQQRVAICNAVAVARLLNATLVLPRFMFSSVWRDTSQFGDIYQEGYFIS